MTYEYICEACGHQWEKEQSIKDSPIKDCEACGKSKAKRLVSGGTGFLLKGGGWYADGYGSPSSAKSSSDESSSKASSSTKSESTSETKPSETKSSETKPTTEAKPAPSTSSTPTPSAKAS
jgi:putative FmdB family regulatory protein